MVFTTRFKILLGLFAVLIVVVVLVVNQWELIKRLDAQSSFDTTVMKNDEKIWGQLQKVASEGAKLMVTPTPTPKLISHVSLTK